MSKAKTEPQVYLWIDQYGDKFWARNLKELCEQIPGVPTPMYVDKTGGAFAGKSVKCGYVIGQHWLTQYMPVESLA